MTARVRLTLLLLFAFACSGVIATPLGCVDPLIGTEGTGSEYGGMMPMTGVPFGSFQAVAMARTNAIGRTSFNALDERLLGVILTRQPAIWMGDWGEVRILLKEPSKIVSADYRPHCTKVVTEKGAVEFTEGCDVYCGTKKDAGIVLRNVYVKPLYERLVGEGWKCLYVLPSEGQYADDLEGTVDGVHPNDWGMMHIAQAFEGVIRTALKTETPVRGDVRFKPEGQK